MEVLAPIVHAHTQGSLKAQRGSPTSAACCSLFSLLFFSDIGKVADVFEKLTSFNA